MNTLTSRNGRYSAVMQDDGNLVVYDGKTPTWASQTARPPDPPPVLPSGLLTGQLSCDGETFSDDTGPRVPLFVHLGNLAELYMRTENDKPSAPLVHQALQDTVDAGYGGIRVWDTINMANLDLPPDNLWYGVSLGPAAQGWGRYRNRMEEFYRIVAEDYEVKLHTAPGDLYQTSQQEDEALFQWRAEVIGANPERFALAEAVNEAYGTTDPNEQTPEYLDSLLSVIRNRAPQVLATWTAAAGGESETELVRWTPAFALFVYLHMFRGAWEDSMRHAFSVPYEVAAGLRRLVWSGEPPGMNWGQRQLVSGMPPPAGDQAWPRGWTPGRAALYGAQTAMCRGVYTYMCSYGVKLEGRLTEAPGFLETAPLVARLPRDVHTFVLFHGGDADRRVLAASATCRVDHAESPDGRVCMMLYGEDPRERHRLSVERPWSGSIYSPTDLGVGQALALSPGAVFEFEMGDGRLLVGARGN